MGEMRVEVPIVKRTLEDYDFLFVGGIPISVTLDLKAGDMIAFSDTLILVTLVAKPSWVDPTVTTTAEKLTIYKGQLLSFKRSTREVVDQTPEQLAERTQLIKTLSV